MGSGRNKANEPFRWGGQEPFQGCGDHASDDGHGLRLVRRHDTDQAPGQAACVATAAPVQPTHEAATGFRRRPHGARVVRCCQRTKPSHMARQPRSWLAGSNTQEGTKGGNRGTTTYSASVHGLPCAVRVASACHWSSYCESVCSVGGKPQPSSSGFPRSAARENCRCQSRPCSATQTMHTMAHHA